MKYKEYPYRHADVILKEPEFVTLYNEVINVIKGITDAELIAKHESYPTAGLRTPKSLSVALNALFRERFSVLKWQQESPIFYGNAYEDKKWRLDFAKESIALEVAFNHGEATSWNLIKPVLSSELNHVKKAIQTEIGIIITATDDLKRAGGFDSAVGSYEKFLTYLPPMGNLLSVPIMIIGLERPDIFEIKHATVKSRKEGKVRLLPGFEEPVLPKFNAPHEEDLDLEE